MREFVFIALVLISVCSATSDCTIAPTASLKTTWCSDCSKTPITEFICQTCLSYHVTADKLICTPTDCSVKPSTYTTSWCNVCEITNQTGSADGKSCVDIDCYVKPTNAYTDDWCHACSFPSLKALADKSGCDPSSETTTTTTTTTISSSANAILSFVSVLAVLLSVL